MQRLKNHMASPIAEEISDIDFLKVWHIYGNENSDLKKHSILLEQLLKVTFSDLVTKYKELKKL